MGPNHQKVTKKVLSAAFFFCNMPPATVPDPRPEGDVAVRSAAAVSFMGLCRSLAGRDYLRASGCEQVGVMACAELCFKHVVAQSQRPLSIGKCINAMAVELPCNYFLALAAFALVT